MRKFDIMLDLIISTECYNFKVVVLLELLEVFVTIIFHSINFEHHYLNKEIMMPLFIQLFTLNVMLDMRSCSIITDYYNKREIVTLGTI